MNICKGRRNFRRALYQNCSGAKRLARLKELVRVRTGAAADDNHSVGRRGKLLGFPLAHRGGVADGVMLLQMLDTPAQYGDNRLPALRGEGRLHGGCRLIHFGQLRRFLRRRHDVDLAARPAACSLDLRVFPLAHHNQRAILARILRDDAVELVDEGAGQINHLAAGIFQLLDDLRRDAVTADEHLPTRCFLGGSDRRNPALAKHVHDRRVVDQFPQRTRGHAAVRHLHGAFDRAADAHAEPRMSRDFNRHFPFASFPAWSDHFLTSILILHIF